MQTDDADHAVSRRGRWMPQSTDEVGDTDVVSCSVLQCRAVSRLFYMSCQRLVSFVFWNCPLGATTGHAAQAVAAGRSATKSRHPLCVVQRARAPGAP